jgi:hypothetical protein
MILLWACIVGVFASAACAMLPIRYQHVPAVILLIAAPILILLIGIQVSAWIAIAAIVESILNISQSIAISLGKNTRPKSAAPTGVF